MPANLDNLLDFETEIEKAAKEVISTITGLSSSHIYTTINQDDFVSPRVEIMFQYDGAIDPTDPKKTTSTDLEYRKNSGQLTIRVVTDAAVADTATLHRRYRGEIRQAMLLNSDFFIPKEYTVSSAGTTSVNGTYELSASLANTKKKWEKSGAGSFRIEYNGSGKWEIKDDSDVYYECSSTNHLPPTPNFNGTWTSASGGSDPAPAIAPSIDAPYYYDINYLRPSGSDFEIDGDLGISTHQYQMNVAIRNDIWPL